MALKYTEAKKKNAPKNQWGIGVEWMSGDADAHDTIKYTFDSEETFLKAKAFFEKIFDWSHRYHNLFCDVLNKDSKERVLNRLKNYYPADMEKFTKILEELLGQHESFSDLLNENGIEPERDVVYDGNIAWPHRIDYMFHYDANGTKMDIEDDDSV